MNRKKTYTGFAIVLSLIMLVATFANIQPAKAQFVIAGSGYPDAYGQGIEVVWSYENSTGSWVPILDPAFLIFPADNDVIIEMNYSENTALKFIVSVNINHSLHGLSTFQEARDIIRVNLTVSYLNNVVFSENDITESGGTVFNDTVTTWVFHYEVVINVLIETGAIYELIATYEVFY